MARACVRIYEAVILSVGRTTPRASHNPTVLTLATRSVQRRRSPRSRHISKEDAAMYPYSIEELAWAAARAIKEEVRQARSGTVEKEDVPKSAS